MFEHALEFCVFHKCPLVTAFQLHGVAIDQSVEACKLTVENAHLNGVSDRLEVLTDTWNESKNFKMLLQLCCSTCYLCLTDETHGFVFGLLRFNSCLKIKIIIPVTVFMILSSWQGHCENSLGSFDECSLSAR